MAEADRRLSPRLAPTSKLVVRVRIWSHTGREDAHYGRGPRRIQRYRSQSLRFLERAFDEMCGGPLVPVRSRMDHLLRTLDDVSSVVERFWKIVPMGNEY